MQYVLTALCLVSSSAFAQSPNEQALGQKLMQEIQASVSCSAQSIAIRQELEKVQAELKALKEKQPTENK